MELGLSLGETTSRSLGFMEKPPQPSKQLGLPFNTTLSIGSLITKQRDQYQEQAQETTNHKHNHNSLSHSTAEEDLQEATNDESLISSPSLKTNNNSLLQLHLLPHTPVNPPHNLSFPWHHLPLENAGGDYSRGLDVNVMPLTMVLPAEDEAEEEAALSSSPNSAASSFQNMDLCIFSRGRSVSGEGYDQRQRGSDEDENCGSGSGSTRKKLRLSKEQSAFLEESFKEHNTLNPKQKLALAKHLHLRPRQVEVWFQNRRARTKLKQTEVDCEYLKRCCDTLTEENRRLHKELQELRALKTSNPFYMQLPATTLTMCPSCERVATNSISTTTTTTNTNTHSHEPIASNKAIEFPIGKPKFLPFPHTQPTSPQNLELN